MMDDDIRYEAIVLMCDKSDFVILHNAKVMQDDQLRNCSFTSPAPLKLFVHQSKSKY